MTLNANIEFKKHVVDIICLLYILLFVYAAVSKLLDFQNFQIQLGQSPLLNPLAGEISCSVPLFEILTAVLLAIPKYRKIGLLAAFALMVLFTAYIYFILNFSSFVPCSCGGILEKMGWKEHFIFNCFFIVLAVTGMLLIDKKENKNRVRNSALTLALLTLVGIGTMKILLEISENKQFQRNNFVRIFPPVAVKRENTADLKYNSYYFAGANQHSIYLGNTTAPALVLELDSVLKNRLKHYIKRTLDRPNFESTQLRVLDSSFFLIDGSAPYVFRGNIKDWKAELKMKNTSKFSIAEVIDSTNIVFRALDNKNNENSLGTIKFPADKEPESKYHPELLQKQIDGIFDTDGIMQYNSYLKNFVYVYYYRNEFIVTDKNLNLFYRGNTIDTTSKAKLKIASLKTRNERKLAAPALIVNRSTAVYHNLLFVNSGLPGRYEPLVMWKGASIIDVYDLRRRLYLMSFYIYDENGKKLSSFRVAGNNLYALIGNSVVRYSLGIAIQNLQKKNLTNITEWNQGKPKTCGKE